MVNYVTHYVVQTVCISESSPFTACSFKLLEVNANEFCHSCCYSLSLFYLGDHNLQPFNYSSHNLGDISKKYNAAMESAVGYSLSPVYLYCLHLGKLAPFLHEMCSWTLKKT